MAFLDSAAQPPMAGGMNGAAPGLPMPDVQGIGGPNMPMMQQQQAPQISPEHQKLIDWASPETLNIAAELDETEDGKSTLGKIGKQCERGFQRDWNSLNKYRDKSKKAMDLASQVAESKTYPWPNASNVIYPLVTVAALSFASRSYPAIIAGRNVVKGVMYGSDNGVPQMAPDGTPVIQGPAQQPGPGVVDTPQGPMQIAWKVPPGAKTARAEAIGEHMSYQLLEEHSEWQSDTDKLLHILPIGGCMFRKSYFDPARGRNSTSLHDPDHLVIHYKTKSMEKAQRISELFKLYPNEIEEKERAELFLEDEYGVAPDAGDDQDAPHEFVEQHCWYDLDDDGYKEPYIVTCRKDNWKVVRIVARYDPDGIYVSKKDNSKILKIDAIMYYTKYDFLPNIDGGFYGMGFGQLLFPINSAINTALNQLLDAGHLATVGGGFIGKGVSMHSGSVRFAAGEWKVVNAPGASIKDSIVPLPVKEPSTVLFQLLGMLITAGKEISATNDVLEGSSNLATMQPTTMLAMIEQGLKVFAAIYKRVHLCLKSEYEKLYRLNRLFLEDLTEYQIGDTWKQIKREDYERGAGVAPYSDPEMVSDMQRMGRAQFLLTFKDDPRMDGGEIIKRALEAAKIDRVDDLFAKQQQPDPTIVALVEKTKAEIKKIESDIVASRSEQVKNYAAAVLSLAKADEAQSDQDMSWITTQMDVMQRRLEMANGMAMPGQVQQPQLEGPEGEDEGGAEEEQPPIPGARKSPKDGLWYAEDTERPGKYVQVVNG